MKIVYLIYNLCHSGGMERILSEKANYLSDVLGYEILIVTSHQGGRAPFFPLSEGVRCIDLKANNHSPLGLLLYMKKLRRLLNDEKPDVTVSMCLKEFPYLPKLDDGSTKIAEFHFSYDSFGLRGKAGRLKRFSKHVPEYERFVVLTDEDKAKWEKVSKDNIYRIYNPVTMQVALPSELSSRRCISAGRYVEQKNHRDMIRAWKLVHDKHPDWKLSLFGSGKLEPSIRAEIRANALEDSVELNPPTKNIGQEMLESSIYLMTSRYEGFPLSLVEAASAGLPAVSYACPTGPSEIIEEGQTGYLVKPGDIEAFAERICSLIEDEGLRSRMSKASLRRAADFSKDMIMSRWDELFRSLVK